MINLSLRRLKCYIVLKSGGREKGKKEGRKAGKVEGKEEAAINLLKSGMLNLEQISEATTLSLKRLKFLAANLVSEPPASYSKKKK